MPDSRPLHDSTTPSFQVGGTERHELARDTLALEIEEGIEGLKRMRLTLAAIGPFANDRDEKLLYVDGNVLDFGGKVDVSMGPRSASRKVFSGKVSAMEIVMQHGRDAEVRVLAEDRLMDLRMTRRFKTYEDVSDSDLVQRIASEHGLRSKTDVDGPTFKVVQQWNQSDLAFLRDRAQRLGADVWVEGDALHMAARDRRDSGDAIALIQGGELLAVHIRADLAHQRTAQNVSGYDEVGKEAIAEEAGASVIAGEAKEGRHGAAVLAEAFGERPTYRVRDVPFAAAEATAWARAELLRRARRFLVARGVTLGTPALAVGSAVKLERVGALFEGGGYYVTHVVHAFDTEQGYRTHFEAERAWIGRAA